MFYDALENKFGKNHIAAFALGAGLLSFSIGANASDAFVSTGDMNTLYAGQTIESGTLFVEVVGDELVVTYNTSGGWETKETHLWIGTDMADMPQTRQGNPKIGNFPYQGADSYSIKLSQLGFSCPSADAEFYVAAHASVQLTNDSGSVIQAETAWAEGSRFVERGMWGTFSTITLSCATVAAPVNPVGQCETAFAYAVGSNPVDGDITNSFLDIDENGDGKGDFNRWGWSIGPVAAGQYQWDIYAGAGQSNINKGTWVGTLTVDYDTMMAGYAIVTFDIDENSPYYMEENHLYVGNEILPRNVNDEFTVAPGQYPTIHDTLASGTKTDSYLVNGLSGDIHVVAHATVCGF